MSASDLDKLRTFEGSEIVDDAHARNSGIIPPHLKAKLARIGSTNSRLLAAQQGSDIVSDESLSTVFFAFCQFGKHGHGKVDKRKALNSLDGKQWTKMMKDCKLLNRKFTSTASDILFAKIARQNKSITLQQWIDALELIVEESGMDIDFIRANIAVGAPQTTGTTTGREKPDKQKRHSCKLSSTVAVGGPKVPRIVTLKFTADELDSLQMMNARNPQFKALMSIIFANTEVSQNNTSPNAQDCDKPQSPSPVRPKLDTSEPNAKVVSEATNSNSNPAAAAMPHTPKQVNMMPMEVTDEALTKVFYTFCAYGKKRGAGFGGVQQSVLDGKQFVKMMKDCKVLNKNFTSNGADILFTKVSRKAKTINLRTWMLALQLVAKETNKDVKLVKQKIVSNGIPQSRSSKVCDSRLLQ